MRVYTYFDDTAPHGTRAFKSLREAKSRRARDFDREERPEIMRVDLGKVTIDKICACITGENYAEHMEDIA